MFRKVLLPTDFSDYARKTTEYIEEIPEIQELILLYILDSARPSIKMWLSGKVFESHLENSKKRLVEQKKALEKPGLTVKSHIKVIDGGSIQKAILNYADAENVSLIVMGARGKGIISDLLLGSVSEGVLRNTKHHMLIMKFKELLESDDGLEKFNGTIFAKILCPVDFSKPSLEVLSLISGLDVASELVLFHVIRSAESKEELQHAISETEKNLKKLKEELTNEKRSLKVTLKVDFGNPVEKICDLAEEENVTLIALPRHGKSDYIKNILLGSTVAEVAKRSKRPVFVQFPSFVLDVQTRELFWSEFPLAEEIWQRYHDQKADRENDRIFGVFVEGTLAAVARCKRHSDGLEVDGVFVPEEYRGRGYARKAVESLVANCGNEPLYMHSTLELVDFYKSFRFEEIAEEELPTTIKERFIFAKGEMEGSNVSPMKRMPLAH